MNLSAPILGQTIHRVAILVDGDNVPRSSIAAVESSARKWGTVTIRRVFGDMALHKDWAQETAYTAMHCPTTSGKNRADMALVVAAMDFAHRGLAGAFVIVSDDRDFGPLVDHLWETGYRVEWLGKPKPATPKVAAPVPAAAMSTPPPASAKPALSALDARLVTAIRAQPEAAVGVTLIKLGNLLKGPAVKEQTGHATWHGYLRTRPGLFEILGQGTARSVRLKT